MIQFLVAALCSGSGKTTLTCALLAALKRRGQDPCSFKGGPDYIDPMFHRAVLGVESHNLDLFFSAPETVRALYAQAAAGHGAAVCEGAMGFYDGLGGVSDTASAWHLADTLGLPVLLVVQPRGASLTLAAELPDARVTAVDISDTALRIARRNAERLRQTVRFERRDILTGPPEEEFDLIVSNPPYVTESEKRQMSPNVLRYEPHRALFVPDDDPLLFYRAIAGLGRRLFAPGGTVYFEINERFGTQTVELLENEGYREIVLSKDFFGKPRTVSARWK